MSVIDSGVVQLIFDNSQFEGNVRQSISTLNDLKKSTDLSESAKSLNALDRSVKGFKFTGISNGVQTVRKQFNAMETVASTAMSRITNSVMSAGKQLVSSFTTKPIVDGFNEMQMQIGSIQTILANTQSKGTKLTDVNKALDELNTYADKTIYNFTQMTQNIGRFTAAGVDLKKSVSSIKGIANLAALSGSTPDQASRAMYQLSQAIAAGKVNLMDWNSVVNAGMGGETFQKALIRTASAMNGFGENYDKFKKKYWGKSKSFRESISGQNNSGWLTTDVLTETFKQFANDESAAEMKSKGFTDNQIKEIQQLGKTAEESATKVRTFKQMFDALSEAAGSGWTHTWQTVIGDFQESSDLLSGINDVLSNALQGSANGRNAALDRWKALGGRDSLIGGLKNVWTSMSTIGKGIDQVWQEIFPHKNGDYLNQLSINFEKFTSKLKPSEQTLGQIKDTFKGLFSVMDIGKQAVTAVGSNLWNLAKATLPDLGHGLLDVTSNAGKFFTQLDQGLKKSDFFNNAIKTGTTAVKSAFGGVKGFVSGFKSSFDKSSFSWIGDAIKKIGNAISTAFGNLKAKIQLPGLDTFQSIITRITNAFNGLGVSAGKAFTAIGKGLGSAFSAIDSKVGKLFGKSGSKNAANAATDVFKNVLKIVPDTINSVGKALNGFNVDKFLSMLSGLSIISGTLNANSLFRAGKSALTTALTTVKDNLGDIKGTFEELKNLKGDNPFTTILNNLGDAIKSYSDKTKGINMIALAGSIGILAGSLAILASIDPSKTGTGIAALGGLFTELIGALAILDKGFTGKSTAKLTGLTAILIGLGAAIAIFAGITKSLGKLKGSQLQNGLVGLGGILAMVSSFMGVMKIISSLGKNTGGMVAGMAMLPIIASSIALLGLVVKSLAKLNDRQMSIGLTGLAGISAILASFVGVMKIIANLGKNTAGMVAGMAILPVIAGAVAALGAVVKSLAKLSDAGLARGLIGTGSIMAMMAAFEGVIKIIANSGKNTAGMAAGMAALNLMLPAVAVLAQITKSLSQLSNAGLTRGLAGVGSLMAMMAAFEGISKYIASTGKNTAGMVAGMVALNALAASMKIMSSIVTSLGSMKGGGLAKGLTSLAVGMTTFVAAFAAIGKVSSGLSSWKEIMAMTTGFSAMVGTFQAFTPSLIALGSQSWGNVAKGLISVAGAVAIFAVAAVKLAPAAAGMLAFSKAFALFGAGMTGIGAGLLMASVAFQTACSNISTSMASVNTLISTKAGWETVKANIEGFFKVIQTAAGDFLKTIGGLAPQIGDTILQLASGLIPVVPELVDQLGQAIVGSLDALDKYAEPIGQKLLSVISKAIRGMTKSSPELVSAVADFGRTIRDSINPEDFKNVATGFATFTGIAVGLSHLKINLAGAAAQVAKVGVIIAEIGGIVAAFGGLASIPGAREWVQKGGDLLQDIGTAIGQFFGGIGGGLAEGFTAAMPNIGADLTSFANEVYGFCQFANQISGFDFSGVTKLAGAMVALTGAEFVDSWATFMSPIMGISRMSGIDVFASRLSSLGVGLSQFSDSISGVNVEQVKGAAEATKILAQATGEIPNTGGLISLLTGDNELGAWGPQLAQFGYGLRTFASSVSGIDTSGVAGATEATKAIAELAQIIPNEGGIVSIFTGDNRLDDFGTELAAFGYGLNQFGSSVKGLDTSGMEDAVKAAQMVANLQSGLQNTGGLQYVYDFFTGNKDLGNFAWQISSFGGGLKSFAESVKGIDTESIKNAAEAGKSLGDMQKGLEAMGGVGELFVGGKNLSTFGTELNGFGAGLKALSDVGKKVDVPAIENMAKVGDALSKLQHGLVNQGGVGEIFGGGKNLSTFGTELSGLGAGLKGFAQSTKGIDFLQLDTAVKGVDDIAKIQKSMAKIGGAAEIFTGGQNFSTLGTELKGLGAGLKDFSHSVEGINPDSIDTALDLADGLVKILNKMPKTGGLKAGIFGDQLTSLNGLGRFGETIGSFAKNIGDISDNEKSVDIAVKAMEGIAKIVNVLPKSGGIKGALIGDQISSLKEFGNFGKEISDFCDSVKDVKASSAGVNSALAIIQSIANVARTLTVNGGTGDAFKAIVQSSFFDMGSQIQQFSQAVKGVKYDTKDTTSGIGAAINVLRAIGGIASRSAEIGDMSAFNSFADVKFGTLGSQIQAFSASVEDVKFDDKNRSTGIVAAINVLRSMGGIAERLGEIGDTSSFSTFASIPFGSFGRQIATFASSTEDVKFDESNRSTGVIAAVNVLRSMGGIAERLNEIGDISGFTTFAGVNWGGFGRQIGTFASSVEDVTFDSSNRTTGVIAAMNVLRSMGGIANRLNEIGDLSNFGTFSSIKFGDIGGQIRSFANSVKDVSFDSSDSTTGPIAAINVLRAMGGIAQRLNEIGDISGFNTFAGIKFGDFGFELGKFAAQVKDVQFDKDENAGPLGAIKLLRAIGGIANRLNEIGDVSVFNNFSGIKFGEFGTQLGEFAKNTSGIKTDGVNSAVDAAKSIVEVATALDGVQNISTFSTFSDTASLTNLGAELRGFSSAVIGIKTDGVESAVSAAQSIVEVATSLSGIDVSGFTTFSDISFANLGAELSMFASNCSNVGDISPAITALNQIKDLATSLSGVDTSGFASLGTSLQNFGTQSVQNFVQAFSGAGDQVGAAIDTMIAAAVQAVNGHNDEFVQAGKAGGLSFVMGLNDGLSSYNFSSTNVLGPIISQLKQGADQFKNAGKSCMTNFTQGLRDGGKNAGSTASSVAKQAASKLKDAGGQASGAGRSMMSQFQTGIYVGGAGAVGAAGSISNQAASALDNGSGYAYTSGVHLGSQFAAGIRSQIKAVGDAASALAAAAAATTKLSEPKKGPLKGNTKSGIHLGQAFAEGIRKQTPNVGKAATAMAAAAAKGVKTASKEISLVGASGANAASKTTSAFLNEIGKGIGRVTKSTVSIKKIVDDTWNEVFKKYKKNKKKSSDTTSDDEVADKFITQLNKNIEKAKKLNQLSLNDEIEGWKLGLNKVKKYASAAKDAQKNANDAVYEAAESFIEKRKKQMGNYITDESTYWNTVTTIVDKGSDAYDKAIDKYNDAILSDAEHSVDNLTEVFGKYVVTSHNTYAAALKAAEKDDRVYYATKKELSKKWSSSLINDTKNLISEEEKVWGKGNFSSYYWYKDAYNSLKKNGANQDALDEVEDSMRSALSDDVSSLTTTLRTWSDITPENYYDNAKMQNVALWKAIMDSTAVGTAENLEAQKQYFSAATDLMNDYNSAVRSSVNNIMNSVNALSKTTFKQAVSMKDQISNMTDIHYAISLKEESMKLLQQDGVLSQAALDYVNSWGLTDVLSLQELAHSSIKDQQEWMKQYNYTFGHALDMAKDTNAYMLKDMEPALQMAKNSANMVGDGLKQALTSTVAGFTADISGKESIDAVVTAIQKLNKSTLEDRRLADIATNVETIGKNLSIGLANGITSGNGYVASAMEGVVNNALVAARAAAAEHSPSKKTTQIGEYMGEGLFNGIRSWAENIANAGGSLITGALDSMGGYSDYVNNLIASISDQMSLGDFAPTITPVVDMTNVDDAADRMEGYFSSAQAISLANRLSSAWPAQNGMTTNNNNNSTNIGRVSINIYPRANQDANDIADSVLDRLNNEIIRKGKVYYSQ